jgi:NAD-dependent dihydropyrimidine dehydrogenase PreA subunit
MDTETQAYRDLQRHLDRLPVGYPSTESGVEIRVLKHLFTPDEAKLATQLSWSLESPKQIHARVKEAGMSLEELEQMLEHMFGKGLIWKRTENGGSLYGNALLVIGMYEFQVDRLTKEFLKDFEQYFNEAWVFEAGRTGISQMRTIPVEQSVPHGTFVSDYDSVRRIVDSVDGQLAVANCVCRQHKDIVGQSCSQSDIRETCLIFGYAAENYISRGVARPISKDEAFGILDKAQKAGFVLQPANSREPQAICCCCGDCCLGLTFVKQLPRPVEFYTTNHYAVVDGTLCSGCEECVDLCQLDAAALENGTVAINLDRCIGCGNCVAICPADAITLHKKEQESVPPTDTETLYASILAKKSQELAGQ